MSYETEKTKVAKMQLYENRCADLLCQCQSAVAHHEKVGAVELIAEQYNKLELQLKRERKLLEQSLDEIVMLEAVESLSKLNIRFE